MLRTIFLFWLVIISTNLNAYPKDSLVEVVSHTLKSHKITDTYLFDKLYRQCSSIEESTFLFKDLNNKMSKDLKLLNLISFARRLEFFGEHSIAIKHTETIRSKNFERLPNYIKAEYYRCLGYISINSEDPVSAIKYYKLGSGFAQETNNLELKQSLLSACGVALLATEDYEKAMSYFTSALSLEVKGVNRNSLKIRLNIALTKSNLGDLEGAKSLFIETLGSLREQKDYSSEIRSLGNIADIYFKQDSLILCEKYYNDAKNLAEKYKQNLDLIRIHFNLSKLYNKKSAFSSAYYHLSLSDSISSLYNSNHFAANLLSEIETENEIKLREDLLSLQIEKERIENRTKWIVVCICGVLVTLLILLFIYAAKLRKKNQLLLKHEISTIRRPENKQDTFYRHKELIERFISLSKKDLITDGNLTLEKLAKKLSTNRTYLSEVLNDQFNLTFSQWINQERVKIAKEMLMSEENDKFSIETIAFSVGFSSTSAFNQQFKAITGLTPSYFRKNRLK